MLKNTKKSRFLHKFFELASNKSVGLFMQTYPLVSIYIEMCMRFVCSEIENFPQRFLTIPIKSMIFNCSNLSWHFIACHVPILQTGSD